MGGGVKPVHDTVTITGKQKIPLSFKAKRLIIKFKYPQNPNNDYFVTFYDENVTPSFQMRGLNPSIGSTSSVTSLPYTGSDYAYIASIENDGFTVTYNVSYSIVEYWAYKESDCV